MPSKGSTTDRGYGWAHQRERAKWVPRVKAGGVLCWRCHRPIPPNSKWDLGHQDGTAGTQTPRYRGPEHIHCNRATKGRRRPPPAKPAALSFFDAEPTDSALGA